MIYHSIFVVFVVFTLSNCAHSSVPDAIHGCEHKPALQQERSTELLAIAKADQADREGSVEKLNWQIISTNDLSRRKRVAEIFAEGCFQTAADYASAATVYQHGSNADHFYQSFLWSQKAFKMGDESRRWWVAAAIDRYLVKVGHKQLFGTQLAKNSEHWCIQPVEPTFPNKLRMEYVKQTVNEQIEKTLKGIGSTQTAKEIKNCEPDLKSSPQGTVPGFW